MRSIPNCFRCKQVKTADAKPDLSAGTRGWNLHWSSSGSNISLFMILFFSSGGMKFSMIRYLQEHHTQPCSWFRDIGGRFLIRLQVHQLMSVCEAVGDLRRPSTSTHLNFSSLVSSF